MCVGATGRGGVSRRQRDKATEIQTDTEWEGERQTDREGARETERDIERLTHRKVYHLEDFIVSLHRLLIHLVLLRHPLGLLADHAVHTLLPLHFLHAAIDQQIQPPSHPASEQAIPVRSAEELNKNNVLH